MILDDILNTGVDVCVALVQWCIWIFTHIQMIMKRIWRILIQIYKEYIITNPTIVSYAMHYNIPMPGIIKNNIEFVAGGKIVHSMPLSEIPVVDHAYTYTQDCDFVIFSEYDKTYSYINKRIIPNNCNIHTASSNQVDESSVKFISSKIKNIPVDFKTEHYNYYIVGNVWTPEFISYFMKTHYADADIHTTDHHPMTRFDIIDHTVQMCGNFAPETEIHFSNHSYDIVEPSIND
jgi:hypothetical protein